MAKWRDVKKGKIAQKSKIEPSLETSQLKHTHVLPRVKAFLTDTFLITTPIFYVVIYLIMGGGEEFSQNRTLGWTLIFSIHSLIILFFWLKNAQTPGLKAYALKLVSTKEEKRVGLIQALIRYVATLITVISIFLLFIPFFRKDKRTFQDIFSNTHIVQE